MGLKNLYFKGDFFVMEKTSDVFRLVDIYFDNGYVWSGAFPKFLKFQGLDLTETEFLEISDSWAQMMAPLARTSWIKKDDLRWKNEKQTYAVLKALHSGEWSCRVCGPVPRVNPQPAARLKDLKQRGYTICSKRLSCKSCSKKTMHDILVMIPIFSTSDMGGGNLRRPISPKLRERIIDTLQSIDVAMDIQRTPIEFVIDHKFPSQRWTVAESDNPDWMSESEIRSKFQLLTNQSNMIKSRACDHCVRTGNRGSFFGISWYYQGDMSWEGQIMDNESGCLGCPWYDLSRWKIELIKGLEKS